MKKTSFLSLLMLVASSIFFHGAYSQYASVRLDQIDSHAGVSSKSITADADKIALEGLKAANAKMYNHFSRHFKDATDLKVATDGQNVNISFTRNGISNRVQYSKKGKWQYSVRTYDESKLSPSLRNSVESAFPGFIVFGFVNEVDVLNKTATLVMIENKKTWKRIRIVDNEMDIYESYTKP